MTELWMTTLILEMMNLVDGIVGAGLGDTEPDNANGVVMMVIPLLTKQPWLYQKQAG
jgi:hypothetical protein